MTSYTFTHIVARRQVPGRFVIKSPGPAFDLIYAREKRRGEQHYCWRLELTSKPPDVALRALLTECARVALESDAWLVASGRVAEMLADPAFAELLDFDSSTTPRKEQVELANSPALQAALAPIVRHVNELARREHVAPRFLIVETSSAFARIEPTLDSILIRWAPHGNRPAPLSTTSMFELAVDRSALSALQRGELLSVPACEEIQPVGEGAAFAWLFASLRTALTQGDLVLLEGRSAAENARALRQLATRLQEPLREAADAVREGLEPAAPLSRAATTLSAHDAIVSAEPRMLASIVARGAGQRIPAPEVPVVGRKSIPVPADLCRFCALFVWPQRNTLTWRGIRKAQVYRSPTWELSWSEAGEASASGGRRCFFAADLESMRLIASGELTDIEVVLREGP